MTFDPIKRPKSQIFDKFTDDFDIINYREIPVKGPGVTRFAH